MKTEDEDEKKVTKEKQKTMRTTQKQRSNCFKEKTISQIIYNSTLVGSLLYFTQRIKKFFFHQLEFDCTMSMFSIQCICYRNYLNRIFAQHLLLAHCDWLMYYVYMHLNWFFSAIISFRWI